MHPLPLLAALLLPAASFGCIPTESPEDDIPFWETDILVSSISTTPATTCSTCQETTAAETSTTSSSSTSTTSSTSTSTTTTSTETTTTTTTGNCPRGSYYNGLCYYRSGGSAGFNHAYTAACNIVEPGGTIAIISSEDIGIFLGTIAVCGSQFWIGGMTTGTGDEDFMWQDMSSTSYHNWDTMYPMGVMGDACMFIIGPCTAGDAPLWRDGCAGSSDYFCQIPPT